MRTAPRVIHAYEVTPRYAYEVTDNTANILVRGGFRGVPCIKVLL